MESGNDYVLQVKGNQPKLLKAVKQTIVNSTASDVDYTLEKNKGRVEHREVYVYSNLDNPIYEEWIGLKEIIHVVSRGKRKNKSYKQNRYYISSKTCEDARKYNEGIREHWGIENRLHWVKDVILKEDKSMVLDLDRSGNMSVIRNIVMNLYRISGYGSIKYAIEKFANRLEKCDNLIYGKLIY